MKQITFSLDDPHDVDVSRLPSERILSRIEGNSGVDPRVRRHPGMVKLKDLDGGAGAYNLHFILMGRISEVARKGGDFSEVLGPIWTIPRDEYRTYWSEVHDNRIIPYLMLGASGQVVSGIHHHTRRVPAPTTAALVTKAMVEAGVPPSQQIAALQVVSDSFEVASKMAGYDYNPGLPWATDRFRFLSSVMPDWSARPADASTLLAESMLVTEVVKSRSQVQLGPLIRRVSESSERLGSDRLAGLSSDHLIKVLAMASVKSSLSTQHCLELVDSQMVEEGFPIWMTTSIYKNVSKTRSSAVMEVIKMVSSGVPVDWAISAHQDDLQ